jgi:hypothetical protein
MSRSDLRRKIARLQEEEDTPSFVTPSEETIWALDMVAKMKVAQETPPFEMPYAETDEEEAVLAIYWDVKEGR